MDQMAGIREWGGQIRRPDSGGDDLSLKTEISRTARRIASGDIGPGSTEQDQKDGIETMKILITGNMGYVGPSVVRRLRHTYPQATLVGLDEGYFAHCLTATSDIFPSAGWIYSTSPMCGGPLRVRWKSTDAIVHLAAISNDPMGNTYEDVTLEINHRASVQLAKMAKAAGVETFVFASSCSMYGSADDRPRKESSALNPLTAYARSKVYHGGASWESWRTTDSRSPA